MVRTGTEVLHFMEPGTDEQFLGDVLGYHAVRKRAHAAVRARPVNHKQPAARLQDPFDLRDRALAMLELE